MRIFRDAVNPHWGTVNRPARFARSFFFTGGGGRLADWHMPQQASSEAASGSSYIETPEIAHLFRYNVTECKHIA